MDSLGARLNILSSHTLHCLFLHEKTLLKDTTEVIPLHGNKFELGKQRPESPSTVSGLITSTPTVGYAIHITGQAFLAVMDNPLSNVPESIVPLGKGGNSIIVMMPNMKGLLTTHCSHSGSFARK